MTMSYLYMCVLEQGDVQKGGFQRQLDSYMILIVKQSALYRFLFYYSLAKFKHP